MNKVKVISNEENRCPYCDCEDSYHVEDLWFSNIELSRRRECKSCGRYYEQWMTLKFSTNGVGINCSEDARDVLGQEVDYDGEE